MPKNRSTENTERARKPKKARKAFRVVIIILSAAIAVLVIAALVVFIRFNVLSNQATEENSSIYESVVSLMPGSETSTWDKRIGDMSTVDVGGTQYVGTIEIPALDVKTAARTSWDGKGLTPGIWSGDPQDGNLIIGGPNLRGVFNGIETVSDNQIVTFTDMDHRVYTYFVVSAETCDANDTQTLESGDENWDLTLFCPSVSGLQLEVLRLASVE